MLGRDNYTCPIADSFVEAVTCEAGVTAELAVMCKVTKYPAIKETRCIFQRFAVETLGVLRLSSCDFIQSLGTHVTQQSGDDRQTQYLLQRISVLLQRFNAIVLRDNFPHDCTNERSSV